MKVPLQALMKNFSILLVCLFLSTGCENKNAVRKAAPTIAPADSSLTVIASQFCRGITILGINGTSACSLTSGAHRTPGISTERDIPVVAIDDDGITTAERPDTSGITSCGSTQNTIAARIADCNYSWDGETKGKMGEGKWSLVTKANGKEVWRDDRTGMVWSDDLGPSKWCPASGNRQIGLGTLNCSANTVSMCAEAAGLESDGFDSAKGGMRKAATQTSPSVSWRLPTRRDYMMAIANGILIVFPDPNEKYFWTATPSSRNDESILQLIVWISPSGPYGIVFQGGISTDNYQRVRCVGR